jgi:hypothetical protein
MSKGKWEKIYDKEDDHLILNHDDPDLTPVVLSLPKAPPLSFIDGYGEKMEDQRFKRLVVPRRLKMLEEESKQELKEENTGAKAYVLTLYKIQKRFWQKLEGNATLYNTEINFIKRVWWHRIHGYWFFNRGKPTYITGWHFMYMNFWTMSTSDQTSRPSYRDRNRKEFIFAHYEYTCTETFKDIDEDGYAIKKDGIYHMVDAGKRLCYGGIQPKNRRGGNTNMGLNNCMEIVTRTERVDGGMGIIAESGNGAQVHLDDKLSPAFFEWPIWLKPVTRTINKDALIFESEKNDYETQGLNTKISAATTENPKFYDGKKLISLISDEQGKATDVLYRWGVLKQCLSQGNGSDIHGYAYLPSTVEDVGEGANEFEFLCSQSNFYRRMENGQTFSGLLRLFIPADEGLDGFIDSYGYSVKDKVLDYQKNEGFSKTANNHLVGERDALLRDGSAAALQTLKGIKKKFPLKYADSFLGDSGDIGFNYENIDTRLAELRRESNMERGNFEWIKGVYGGDVEFILDPGGRFQVSGLPPVHFRNKKIKTLHYSSIEGKDVPMFAPANPGAHVLGADPFRWANKQEASILSKKTGSKSRLSDGGIAVFRTFDPGIDGDKPKQEWETYKFVMSYRYRSLNADDYNEDILKAAIFYGAMVYPETNAEITWEYFVRRNYGGYLLFDVDRANGRKKDKPGVFNLERSKNVLFSLLRDYLDQHCHHEDFASFLEECKAIRGKEEMRAFDRLTAHGLCLMGASGLMMEALSAKDKEDELGLDDFIEVFPVG